MSFFNFPKKKYEDSLSLFPEKETLYYGGFGRAANDIRCIIDEILQTLNSIINKEIDAQRSQQNLLRLEMRLDALTNSYESDNDNFVIAKQCREVSNFLQEIHDALNKEVRQLSKKSPIASSTTVDDGLSIHSSQQDDSTNASSRVNNSQDYFHTQPSEICETDQEYMESKCPKEPLDTSDVYTGVEFSFTANFSEDSTESSRTVSVEDIPSPLSSDYLRKELSKEDADIPYSPIIDLETIGNVLECKIPTSGYFTPGLCTHTEFNIDVKLWDQLYGNLISTNNERIQRGETPSRLLPKGEWQKLIADGINDSNPYCVFAYKNHVVSISEKKRKSSALFSAHGKCIFSSCDVEIHLQMTKIPVINVTYSGSIKHLVGEKRARPIRTGERRDVMNILECGKKPMKLAAEIMEKKSNKSLLMGNMNNIGVSKFVLQKISSESHQKGRKDKDVNESLLKMKEEYQRNLTSGPIQGFIQNIGLDPVFIYYWLPNSLHLWSKMAKNCVSYIDATGNISRKSRSGTNMLYYEISFQNPIEGETSIPIAGALLERQNQPQISDFLNHFKYSEKLMKGISNVSQPLQVNCDWGMAIILSVMDVFNSENMRQHLDRCWKIVSGNAMEEDFRKTIIHICISHHMKIMKKKCWDSGAKNFNFKMYFCSLLVNSSSLEEVRELLVDGAFVFLNKLSDSPVKAHTKRLTQKINQLDAGLIDTELDDNFTSQEPLENTHTPRSGNYFTEEVHIMRCKYSPFKSWAESVVSSIRQTISESAEGEVNPNFCPNFFNILMDMYIPTLPLWSNIMLGNIKRLSSRYIQMNIPILKYDTMKTSNNVAEGRFTVLKQIFLNKRRQLRYDDISYELEKVFTSCQKMALLAVVHKTPSKQRQRKLKKSQTLVNESWKKPEKILINQVGRYQQPPKTPFSVIESKASVDNNKIGSGMKNLGNTCWFNSVIQAINATNLASSLIRNSDSNTNPTMKKLIDMLEFMQAYCDRDVPGRMIKAFFDTDFGRMIGGQQYDASEFLTSFLSDHIIEENNCFVELENILECSECSYISTNVRREFCLFVSIPEYRMSTVFIQDLLKTQNQPSLCQGMTCPNCHMVNKISIKIKYKKLPETIILILRRYIQTNKELKKNEAEVVPDENMIINEEKFTLKSLVCHHGIMGNGGHYTAHGITNGQIITFDDDTVEKQPLCGDWPHSYKRNCYILFYNKIYTRSHKSIPMPYHTIPRCNQLEKTSDMLIPVISLFMDSQGMRRLIRIRNSPFVQYMKERDAAKIYSLLTETLEKKNDYISLIRCFIEYISRLSEDPYFSTEMSTFILCMDCPPTSKSTHILYNRIFIQEIGAVTTEGILETLKEMSRDLLLHNSKHLCDKCGNVKTCISGIFDNLPYSFLFSIKCLPTNFPSTSTIDLTSLVNKINPYKVDKYKLQGIILNIDGNPMHIEYNEVLTENDRIKDLWNKSTVGILILDKIHSTSVTTQSLRTEPMPNDQGLADLIYDSSFSLGSFAGRTYHGKEISRRMLEVILSNEWLDSDIIEIYMFFLGCKISKRNKMNAFNIHPAWLMQKQFVNGDPRLPKSELIYSHRHSWFYNQYILIPCNIECRHWILVIVDTVKKEVIFCNSTGVVYNTIILQVFNYMYQQYFRCFSRQMDVSEWTVRHFHDQDKFPLQEDNSSCGTYICMMAKSILFEKKFHFCPVRARYTMARELADNILIA